MFEKDQYLFSKFAKKSLFRNVSKCARRTKVQSPIMGLGFSFWRSKGKGYLIPSLFSYVPVVSKAKYRIPNTVDLSF